MRREIILHDRPGIITVRLEFDAPGEPIAPHVHCFGHTMRVEAGAAKADFDGQCHILRAGEELFIPADVSHGIMPLMGGTVVSCEHEIRKENGEHDPQAFSEDGIPVEWLMRLTKGPWGPTSYAR